MQSGISEAVEQKNHAHAGAAETDARNAIFRSISGEFRKTLANNGKKR